MVAFTRHWVSSYLAFPPLPCHYKRQGGISLLHFSWGRPRRVLPVILALWSPDFPHERPFRTNRAAVQLTCPIIIDETPPFRKGNIIENTEVLLYNILVKLENFVP